MTRFEVSPEVDAVLAVHSGSKSSYTSHVSMNSEMCMSSPLLTQLGGLTHFSNNEASSKEVSRNEVAVNQACQDKVANQVLNQVPDEVSNDGETGVSSQLLTLQIGHSFQHK